MAAAVSLAFAGDSNTAYPTLDSAQMQWLGDQIFRNECNRQNACLTAWNPGEDFPSLGIGHFIWYKSGQEEIYTESFPDLLRYLQQAGVQIPAWIEAGNYDSPWQSREEFLAEVDSPRMRELRQLLAEHTQEQTAFIIGRFESALADILASVPDTQDRDRIQVRERFYQVAAASPPLGLYALIDYVNFKGTGTSPLEAYANQGWGLKQVLLGMDSSQDALPAFVDSARRVLAARVKNAPPERNESRWLNGWNNRLDSYINTSGF